MNKIRKTVRRVTKRHCGTCGKDADLFHVCAISTDFSKRKSRPARQGRPGQPEQHDYKTCGDDKCTRRPCVTYREGMADCVRPHQ